MFHSTAVHNATVTNASFFLRAAVEVRPIAEQVEAYDIAKAEGRWAMKPNFEVLGSCGHRLEVIGGNATGLVKVWESRIAAGRKHRRRCESCPKD